MKFLQITLSLVLCLLFVSCNRGENKEALSNDEEEFTGLPEFKEAYTSVKESISHNDTYDIEQTIRVMNTLDMAMKDNANLEDYLQRFARTDFSNVAPEILKSKQELLDILQEMRKAELEEETAGTTDVFLTCLRASKKTMDKIDPDTIKDQKISAIVFSIGKETALSSFNELEHYVAEKKDIKESFRQKIQELKNRYLLHISSYTPIYEKYCREWDTLCLMRDKAYIAINNGGFDQSYKTTEGILEKYPENRETLLLNALSLSMLGMRSLKGDASNNAPLSCMNYGMDNELPLGEDSSVYFEKASAVLDKYLSLYPNYSAPALVLQGIIAICKGQDRQGLTLLDQASVVFPQQSSYLKEMLDLYKSRAYLNKSVEGMYLFRLYQSTMEGYGIFSPNLVKAGYYAQHNEAELSKKEMFNHFFRSENQASYDSILFDMQFCEMFLDNSFKKMFAEHSFLDLIMSNSIMGKKKLNVSIDNRSNVNLQNVRIFLCLHLTGMYSNEYTVVKVPSKNVVPALLKTDFDLVSFDYEDKTYDDISHVRAIVMTDDAIFWLDDPKYKLEMAESLTLKVQNAKQTTEQINHNMLFSGLSMNDLTDNVLPKISAKLVSKKEAGFIQGVAGKLSTAMTKSIEEKWEKSDGKLKCELPRDLLYLDPVFSLKLENDKSIQPSLCFVDDKSIKLMFDALPKENSVLYIYNKYVPCRVLLAPKDDMLVIQRIELN